MYTCHYKDTIGIHVWFINMDPHIKKKFNCEYMIFHSVFVGDANNGTVNKRLVGKDLRSNYPLKGTYRRLNCKIWHAKYPLTVLRLNSSEISLQIKSLFLWLCDMCHRPVDQERTPHALTDNFIIFSNPIVGLIFEKQCLMARLFFVNHMRIFKA